MYNQDNYNQDPECVMILRNIPRELRRRFKGWCSTRGDTMTNVVREFMYRCVTGEQQELERRMERQRRQKENKLKLNRKS